MSGTDRPLLPVVDGHVHFWDRHRTGLRYEWLDARGPDAPLGDLDGIRSDRFGVSELRGESRLHGVAKVVHMNAARPEDGLAETAWLERTADHTGWPNAIVASCDLAADDAAEQIERHALHSRLRGFREMRSTELFDEPAFRRGYRRLAELGLVFFHTVGGQHWERARDLVEAFPSTTFCVDQSGMPLERNSELLAVWLRALRALGREPNVVCKISSLGMADPRWTVESRRPWVHGCLEAFGPERCFVGSNWPIERRYSSYGDVIETYRTLVADLSTAEQGAVLAGTAERVLRM